MRLRREAGRGKLIEHVTDLRWRAMDRRSQEDFCAASRNGIRSEQKRSHFGTLNYKGSPGTVKRKRDAFG